MTKNIYKLEVFLILLAVIVASLSIYAIFSAPSAKYVKLIKWSDADSIESIFESTSKRLYPLLAEANHIKIKNFEAVSTLAEISSFIKKTTQIQAVPVNNPDLIVLSNQKKNDIQLEILFEVKAIKDIDLNQIFDSKSFKKILKIKDRNQPLRKYIFCLYQTKSNQFILNIIENI